MQLIFQLGFFDSINQYRVGFEELNAGSTIGINLNSAATFIPKFILSFLYQVFGFWIFSPKAFLLFIIESIPFLFAFIYIIINIKYASKFAWVIIVFFIAFNSIWVVGNDNLGTAVRLRMFAYIPTLIVFLMLYQAKQYLRLKEEMR
jgi:hypothetical protein